MPWLVVRSGSAGADGEPLGGVQLVQDGTSPEAVARAAWLYPLALIVVALLVGVMALAFASHLYVVLRRPGEVSRPPDVSSGARGLPLALVERAVLAAYFLLAAGAELLRHQHLFGRAVILSGGNDWLAYESFARDILFNGPLLMEGRALGQGLPFYYQPLYSYWIALTHLVLGEGLFAPLLMNAVLGIITGLGLYLLTRELFGRAAAFVAVPLFELCRLTVFAPTAGLLLSENLVFPLVPIFLLLLARLVARPDWRTAVGAGFVLGLAGLARTTPLALVPPAVLILLLGWRGLRLGRLGIGPEGAGIGWRRIGVYLTLMLAACTLTVGLATVRNYVVSGRVVPITSSAGANLWETHRPSSKVDLDRIDKDPLYERLGLDRTTREVVEFIRQDPAGYVGTLVPMFLFAVGVRGAVVGTWDVQPILFGLWLAYLVVTLAFRPARTQRTWFVHAFIWSHLAQMTIFFSHQYGFRLILPMYVAMVPIAAFGVVAVAAWLGRRLAPFAPRLPARAPLPPVMRVSLALVAVVGGAAGLGAGGWRTDDAAREAFYGVHGDVALAVRQAARPDLLRRADSTYFVGDDSRTTDVAYLSGLAFPTLRWFDGARGLVLPPAGEQALYVLPDRAAADFAERCLGEGAVIGREWDQPTGLGLDLMLASSALGACAAPRETLGATFAESGEATARLIGIDGPASIEPGRALDISVTWEVISRPRNRARPTVRLVDSRGRRWGQGETAAYPSAAWRPGERAVGVARIDVDPTLPPGEYRLEGGFSAGSGQARLTDDGPWGSAGLTGARGPGVRLVSRSTPLESVPATWQVDAALDGGRLIGATVDREALRAGERLRLSLFWERSGAAPRPREVSILAKRARGATVREWRGVPVDGTYPTTAWKPGETVRDSWDLVVPASLPTGEIELLAGLAEVGQPAAQNLLLGTVKVEAVDRELKEPELRARLDTPFGNEVELVGVDSKSRRARAGDTLDMTLVWRASATPSHDYLLTVALQDERGGIAVLQENEPAGGKRPSSGWTTDEYVEDGWKVRLPRELPPGRARIVVSVVDPVSNQRVPSSSGSVWVELPFEVNAE
jgi:4-amino-4-deoxy-L-arabinose transferase-like glycosyltransferase